MWTILQQLDWVDVCKVIAVKLFIIRCYGLNIGYDNYDIEYIHDIFYRYKMMMVISSRLSNHGQRDNGRLLVYSDSSGGYGVSWDVVKRWPVTLRQETE